MSRNVAVLFVNAFFCMAAAAAYGDSSSEPICPNALEVLAASEKIDSRPAFKDTTNYQLNQTVLDLAECYDRTGEAIDAEVVTRVLLRYAEFVRSWPLITRDGQVADIVDFTQWDLGGLWGGEWIYVDLGKSANLARAFEYVADSPIVDEIGQQLGIDARTTIREELLHYLVDFNLRFGRGPRFGTNTREAVFTFVNMDPYRLQQLVVFGRVVDPAYIHIAVQFLRQFMTVGFFRDGFWHEGTVSYHRQVVNRLEDLASELTGYSDPPGYHFAGFSTLFGDIYPGVPGRFENLEPLDGVDADFARTLDADRVLTLPDGRMLAKNDTHHDANFAETGDPSDVPSHSICLFGLRHCVLVANDGSDRTLVHLDYGGTEGHEHFDALHLDLWAIGRLLLGDGTYRGFSPREWNNSTAAHNTVVVDRVNQDSRFDDRAALTVYDEIDGVGNYLWQGYGHGDSENAGELLAADLSAGPVQYVSTDAARSYNAEVDIKRYQRTLILVDGESGDSYIIDVFYVNGGFLHEWMLHGDLWSDPELSTTLHEEPANGDIGAYLKIERTAPAEEDWSSTFVYPEDGRRLQTYHLGHAKSDVAIAKGPAEVREGDANYLVIGRLASRNTFVAVHVPRTENSPIESVTRLPSSQEGDGCMRIGIEFASGRSDEIALSTRRPHDADGSCDPNGGFFRHEANAPDGRCLWRYRGDLPTDTSSWQHGVIEVFRERAGDSKNGFGINNWPASDGEAEPALLHLQLPNGAVESYSILGMERTSDRSVFVEVDGEPGLAIKPVSGGDESNSLIKQLYYPSRGFVGSVAYRTTTNVMENCDTTQ